MYINNTVVLDMTDGDIHANSFSDVYKFSDGTFAHLEPGSRCAHCGREFLGWFTDAAFTTSGLYSKTGVGWRELGRYTRKNGRKKRDDYNHANSDSGANADTGTNYGA